MRITRETLVRIAKETAQKRALSDGSLIAAYLTGSLLSENPFLGNTTDIDIVFVTGSEPKARREIVPVTPEVHLDIRNQARSEYDRPKELRVHPCLGPELYDPMPLYVTRHFFEFVQAGVRDKYHDPSNVLERSRREVENSRRSWSKLTFEGQTGPEDLLSYLEGVELAANAVALLNGGLLTERRLLLQFPLRAEAAGQPELTPALVDLLGGGQIDAAGLHDLLPEWEKAFVDAASRSGVEWRIALPRLEYYKACFDVLLAGSMPQAILWPLLLTWSQAACVLPPTRRSRWQEACSRMGLPLEVLPRKKEALDAFIDSVEELLERFSRSNNL